MRTRMMLVAIFLFGSAAIGGAAISKSARAITAEPAVAGATITISNFQFTPKVVRIKVGGLVTWEVKEGTHTVNADDGSFGSPNLSAGQKFSHEFRQPGTYRYYCSFHGSKGGHDMAGSIVVTR